jgi:hypothetical protein
LHLAPCILNSKPQSMNHAGVAISQRVYWLEAGSAVRCLQLARDFAITPPRRACDSGTTDAGLSRVQGSGFRVQGSGFRVQGSGFRAQGSRFRVQDSGLEVQGIGYIIQTHASPGPPPRSRLFHRGIRIEKHRIWHLPGFRARSRRARLWQQRWLCRGFGEDRRRGLGPGRKEGGARGHKHRPRVLRR